MSDSAATAGAHLSQGPGDSIGAPGAGAALVRTLAIAFVGTGLVLATLVVLAERQAWWRGLLGATLVSAIAAGMSLIPLLWGLRRRLDQLVAAFFIAAGIRAAVSLGGCLVAVFVGRYPAAPMMLMMVCYYFVLLAIETLFVARTTWSAKR